MVLLLILLLWLEEGGVRLSLPSGPHFPLCRTCFPPLHLPALSPQWEEGGVGTQP